MSVKNKSFLIFACSNFAQEAAKKISAELDVEVGNVLVQKFSNTSTFVQFKDSVRGKNVYLIQNIVESVDERIMELMIAIDAASRAGAKKIIVVLPYFPYSRSDKKDQPRVPITAKMIANMLEVAGASRVLTFDLHNSVIQAYFNKVKCDILSARADLVKYLKSIVMKNTVVVATDAGSAKLALKYADDLGVPVAMISKHREGNNDIAIADTIVGDVANKNCLIVDDEIDTAGTILEATRILKESGANQIRVVATHGILSGLAVERLNNSRIEEVVLSDTVPVLGDKMFDGLKIVSITDRIAKAIYQIENNCETDELFEP